MVADATDLRKVGKPKMGATTVRTAASRLSRGAILIPEPKPADGHSRCELEPGTPKTRGKALYLVSRRRSPTLRVVYFEVRRFDLPKPLPKPGQERLPNEVAQPSRPIWSFRRGRTEGNGETHGGSTSPTLPSYETRDRDRRLARRFYV